LNIAFHGDLKPRPNVTLGLQKVVLACVHQITGNKSAAGIFHQLLTERNNSLTSTDILKSGMKKGGCIGHDDNITKEPNMGPDLRNRQRQIGGVAVRLHIGRTVC
jgi:hypothetical protein